MNALETGTICYQGALRHVPTDHDASPTSAWERTHTPVNDYQNGAYWHTPSGWLIAALAGEAPQWAERIFRDMVAHLEREDFRKGPGYGAPWECLGRNGLPNRNSGFLGSVVAPYGVMREMAANGGGGTPNS